MLTTTTIYIYKSYIHDQRKSTAHLHPLVHTYPQNAYTSTYANVFLIMYIVDMYLYVQIVHACEWHYGAPPGTPQKNVSLAKRLVGKISESHIEDIPCHSKFVQNTRMCFVQNKLALTPGFLYDVVKSKPHLYNGININDYKWIWMICGLDTPIYIHIYIYIHSRLDKHVQLKHWLANHQISLYIYIYRIRCN